MAQGLETLARSDGTIETFYVPAFRINLRSGNPDATNAPSTELPLTVVRDIIRVSYHDSLKEIDGFELTVNNWDASARKFKYVGLPNELAATPPAEAQYFEPGRMLELYMGYEGDLHLMMIGQITALEPDYPSSGSPTLTVRGLNVLHRFRKTQHTYSWFGKRDSEIAREIGQNSVSDSKPGLGMTVEIDDNALSAEKPEDVIFMNNQFDIVFLLERARRRGYSLFLQEQSANGQIQRSLLFGPSTNEPDITYALEWGKSLVQFKPTLTTARQISQVTVRGWNRRTAKPIVGIAKWGDPGITMNRDQQAVALAVQGNTEVVADRPVYTEAEAKALAKDILIRQLKEMVKANGATVGLPSLRAGRVVTITNLGDRFDGDYYVTDTSHTVGDDGYRTTFTARRETEGGET